MRAEPPRSRAMVHTVPMDSESVSADQPAPDVSPLETGTNPRTRTQRVLVLSVALILAAGTAAVLVNTGKQTPERELAEVRAFVVAERTARVTGRTINRYGSGDDEAGNTSTDRSKVEGELRIPDASHVISNDGDFISETIIVGKDVYTREGETRAELRDEQWAYESTSAPNSLPAELAEANLSPSEFAAVGELTGSMSSLGMPVDLPTVLALDKKVTRTGTAQLTLIFTMRDFLSDKEEEAFEKMSDAFGDPNVLDDEITVVVNHGPDGRLDRLSLDTESEYDGETDEFHLELTFSRWGEAVDISAPGSEAIDRTPGIDEASLARFKDFTVMAPEQVPANFLLIQASAEPEDAETEMCASASLTYTPASEVGAPGGDEGDYERQVATQVTIQETDATCEYFEEPTFRAPGQPTLAGGRPVTVHDGLPEQYFGELEIEVPGVLPITSVVWRLGDTSFVVSGHRPSAELLDFATSMVGLDLSRHPVHREASPG